MQDLKSRYKDEIVKELYETFEYANVMQVPKVVKVVINRRLGEALTNSRLIDITLDQFRAISGQKPVLTLAKESVSNFKVRKGQAIGCKVTMRGDKMYDFLTKLFNVALPTIRDFRGLPENSFDHHGNYNFGLKETVIFPEIRDEDKQMGMDICIVTTAKTKKEARLLLSLMGLPFRQQNQ